ncbi:MAG: acetate/propionate family kinase [Patescibacteria group bacterium]|nr:acetate/propionate family kinase [Patescibacteria group bacterium]
MSILVINSGSTSLKYKLFDNAEKEIKQGVFTDIASHETAIKNCLREIGDLRGIKAVGHRVVHGGDQFIKPTLINDEVLAELEKFSDLAPLHNPYNIAGIKAVSGFLPETPQVAVFDTAFFADLPEAAKIYALPISMLDKYKIKRYGFHGISHQFAMREAAKQLNRDVKKINLITCHLGGGWSITAIKGGKPIDTSMGWTPLGGLVMMTRAGDLDPGIVVELLRREEAKLHIGNLASIENILNRESGIKGLSGGITDYQKLLREVSLGNKQAKLAFDVAIYKLCKYIGAYWAILQGKVDAIVFTGAIGAGNPMTRNAVIAKLKFLNNIPAMAVKANEELMIAKEVRRRITHNA